MKLSPREAPGYLARPDPARAGLLLYGADPMRVALKRQEAVAALIGPQGEAEMRLTRIAGADLRRDQALIADAVKAIAFFPGTRVVLVEEASDAGTPALEAALESWRPGDAVVVVTAGALQKGSSLRRLFEAHPGAYALGLYDDPPTREEIESDLRRAGLQDAGSDTLSALTGLARQLDPGEFRQTVEKLALYMLSANRPAAPEDLDAVAPQTIEAGLDEAVHAAAEGRSQDIGPLLRRIEGQGVTPVALCLAATRHFRQLLAAASDPGGPGTGIGRLRPPVFGPRRDSMERQARRWDREKLEQALGALVETDLTLRSSSRTPGMPLVERTLIRISSLGRV